MIELRRIIFPLLLLALTSRLPADAATQTVVGGFVAPLSQTIGGTGCSNLYACNVLPHVPANSGTGSLPTLTTVDYPNGVIRDAVATPGDFPPQFFYPETGTCTANSRTASAGICVNTTSGDGNSFYAINATPFVAWTPTFSCVATPGTFAASLPNGTTDAQYQTDNYIVRLNLTFSVTTLSTCATAMTATLPVTAFNDTTSAIRWTASGRDSTSGKMVQGWIVSNGTVLNIVNYDNTLPGADVINIFAEYRIK